MLADRVVSEDLDRAGVGPARAHGQRDRRGLAGAVGPEDSEDGAGVRGQVDSVDDAVRAVGVLETANGQGRR